MKIKELIDILKNYDPETSICTRNVYDFENNINNDCHEDYEICEIIEENPEESIKGIYYDDETKEVVIVCPTYQN